ncbi:hypothetical protein MRX96_019378 [Rhipicephalus microplus]
METLKKTSYPESSRDAYRGWADVPRRSHATPCGGRHRRAEISRGVPAARALPLSLPPLPFPKTCAPTSIPPCLTSSSFHEE